MNRNGMISSAFISKFALTIAVILLLSSVMISYKRINKTTQEEKLEKILQIVSKTLRRADTLPGDVKLVRELPSTTKNYRLIIMRSKDRDQLAVTRIVGGENFSQSVFLTTELENGSFKAEVKNPQKLVVEKSSRISVEVV